MPETITSHTPGPWMAAAKPSSIVGWPVVAPPTGRMICDVSIAPKPSDTSDGKWSQHFVEVAANARLIASAPELLEALRMIADETNVLREDDSSLVKVRAQRLTKWWSAAENAIAAATGDPDAQ